MPLSIPAELKKISPFVRRAEELDRDKTSAESRLVAYYCRQFAVHTGIPLASTSPAAKTCLGHLLEALEKEKPAMDNFTRDEAAFLCRKFATNIFDKADEEDREGRADKNTAKTFYAAATFIQILEQFEEEDSEQMGKDKKQIIYAKWKATDILKALKEGRTPTPGGFGEDDDEEEEKEEGAEASEGTKPATVDAPPAVETVTTDEEEEETFDIPAAPRVAPPKPTPPPPVEPPQEESEEDEDTDDEGQEVKLGPPPAYPGPTTSSTASSTNSADRPHLSFELPPPVSAPPLPAPKPVPTKTGGGGIFGFGKKKGSKTVTRAQIADATELARFALSALEDKDADLAADRLQQALAALGR